MAASIEGAFILIDRASDTMAKMERQAAKTMAAIEGVGAAQDALAGKSSRSSQAFEREARSLRTFESGARSATSATTGLARSHDDLGRSQQRSTQRMGLFQRVVRSVRNELGHLRTVNREVTRELANVPGFSQIGRMFQRAGSAAGGAVGGALGGVSSWFSDLRQFASSSGVMKTLGAGVRDAGDAFEGLGTALMALKWPAVASAIQPVIAAIDALGGGLLMLLPMLGQASQSLLALPAAGAAAVQTFGVLKLAVNGVMQAVQLGSQAQQLWGLNQQQWQQQVVQATDGVKDSQMRLNDALYSERQAQLSLTIARRDATRQLQDMAFAAQDAILKEARAGLNIRQAQAELQQAMMTPGTSMLQIESDRLAVLEAQANAQQTHTQAVRSQVDYARARRRDPTSEPIMRVAQAQHASAVAIYEVARAQKSLEREQYQLNLLLSHGNAGVQAYNKALMQLEPSQAAFVRFLVGPMGPGSRTSIVAQIQELQNAAGQGLFPPLERALRGVTGMWGSLQTVVRDTGGVIGRTAGGLIRIFSDPHWLLNVGEGNVQILHIIGGGLLEMGQAIKQMIQGGQPFLKWIAAVFSEFAKWVRVHETVSHVAQTLTRAEGALKILWAVLRNVWIAFANILHAAAPAGNLLYGSIIKASAAWDKWTARNQNGMQQYFFHLLPTLKAVWDLFAALVKAFVQLGGAQGQGGAQALAKSLIQLVPLLQMAIAGASQFLPIILQIAGPATVILSKLIAGLGWLLQHGGPLRDLLAGIFVAGVLTRFLMKFAEFPIAIGKATWQWKEYKKAKDRALASPGGTGGRGRGGFFRRLFGGGGLGPGAASPGTTGVGAALASSHTWGVLSLGGPGSAENPLMVRIEGRGIGGGSAGNPFQGGTSTLSKAGVIDTAAQDASKLSRVEGIGAWLMGRGALGRGAARVFSKVPGLGGLASENAAAAAGRGAAVVGETTGILSKLGPLAGIAKFAGPLGLALSALPAITTFFTAKGGFTDRLGQAVSAGISGLTFGIVHPDINLGVSAAHQRAQGTGRASTTWQQMFSGGRNIDPTTGLLSGAGLAAYHHRISTLQSQIRGATTSGAGVTRTDAAVVQDRQAQIKRLESIFSQEQWQAGQQAAKNWGDAYQQGIQSGEKPKAAMGNLMAGLTAQMDQLNPMGRRSLQNSMASWAYQMQLSGQLPKAQVDQLNQYIIGQFQGMGKQVEIVNGQILDGSTAQWQSIAKALTDPMDVAMEKLSGQFSKIQQEAVGELQTMGLDKSTAQMLVKNPKDAANWMKFYNQGAPASSTSGIGHRAGGGRVPGSDPRDVFPYGGNMLGGGELVMNKWHEADANSRLMRHGEPTVGAIVASRNTPHWFAGGGRTPPYLFPWKRQLSGRATGGYALPLPRQFIGGNWSIDQGVDINGGTSAIANAPLYAVGSGTIIQEGISGFGPNAPVLQLDAPIGGNRNVYYGHAGADTVPVGAHVTAGQQISRVGAGIVGMSTGPHLEIGFGPPFTNGSQMSVFLHQLLGGGKLAPQFGSAGAPGTPTGRIPPLRVPRITGLGGVPLALVGGASTAYANALTGALNANSTGLGSLPPTGGGSATANQHLAATMLGAFGWGQDQMPYLSKLWTKESNWSATALNKASGAFGIPQSLPASKMASAGPDWQTNPATQIKWGLGYIRGRYGSPAGAWAHEMADNWYAEGGRIRWGGWNAAGGTFRTNGPTLFGAGEGGISETVSISSNPTTGRPVTITIHKIEVNRKGDVKKIVDEELALLADSLRGR